MSSRKIQISFFTVLFLAMACHNNDRQNPAQTADSTAAAKSGHGTGSDSNSFRSSASDTAGNASHSGNSAPAAAGSETASNKGSSKSAGKAASHGSKKSAAGPDSSKTNGSQSAIPTLSPANAGSQPSNAIDLSKPFAPKYGLIPWDANQNNITDFKNAFPDKQTLVRVNFDNDPDDQMQKEKATIIDALKKAGYKNVSDQSKTFHPVRTPKDIHYELQRDGSVVIWLPPLNQ